MSVPEKRKEDNVFYIIGLAVAGLVIWFLISSLNAANAAKRTAEDELMAVKEQLDTATLRIDDINAQIKDQTTYIGGVSGTWFDTCYELREYAENTPILEPIEL